MKVTYIRVSYLMAGVNIILGSIGKHLLLQTEPFVDNLDDTIVGLFSQVLVGVGQEGGGGVVEHLVLHLDPLLHVDLLPPALLPLHTLVLVLAQALVTKVTWDQGVRVHIDGN